MSAMRIYKISNSRSVHLRARARERALARSFKLRISGKMSSSLLQK